MTKYNIEEGEVLEKKPSRKKLFLAVICFILIGAVFFLYIKPDLLSELIANQPEKKTLDNPDKSSKLINSNRDWSNDIAELNLLVERLRIDNQNFKANLKKLTDKLNQTNVILENEPEDLTNKQINFKIHRALQTTFFKLDKQLKGGRNFKTIQSNFDELILLLSLYSENVDDSIFTQINTIKKYIDKKLDTLINEVDADLIGLDNELWGVITSNTNSEPLLQIDGVEKVEEKPIRDKSDEYSTPLTSRLKEEIMRFIDIEPLNNTFMPHISDINRLRAIAELSIKIGIARTLLINLEIIKLNSHLSVIKNNFKLYFPEMENPKISIDSIFEKINNFDLEVEELDEILRLLKINIEEQ